MSGSIEQWTVTDAYAGGVKVFESETAALHFACENAMAVRPTLITGPDGRQTLVMRPDPSVQIQAVRKLT